MTSPFARAGLPRRFLGVIALILLLGPVPHASAQTTLLNVSYDPTRELYRDINALFAAEWKKQAGEAVAIRMCRVWPDMWNPLTCEMANTLPTPWRGNASTSLSRMARCEWLEVTGRRTTRDSSAS